jgi:hypothetical protein
VLVLQRILTTSKEIDIDTVSLLVLEVLTRTTQWKRLFVFKDDMHRSIKGDPFQPNFYKQFNIHRFLLLSSQMIMLPLLGVWMLNVGAKL